MRGHTKEEIGSFTEGASRIAAELSAIRKQWRQDHSALGEYGRHGFPSRASLSKIIEALASVLYPMRLGPDFVWLHNEDVFVEETLQTTLGRLYGQIRLELLYTGHDRENAAVDDRASEIVTALARQLPEIRQQLDRDVEAACSGDPAARSIEEVLICYPSMLAIIHHRIAHQIFLAGATMVARIIAEIAHSRTGIDIHPGAQIGDYFFIDHGTGVVIGETAIIGAHVRLYQGVTLGARSFPRDENGHILREEARHPVLEDHVVIYAGATILGRVTIGRGSEIGGNVWLTHDIPAYSRVIQATERLDIVPRVSVSE